MIKRSDYFCKIITEGDAAKKIAKNALLRVNIPVHVHEQLMNEKHMEIRKLSSDKPGMSHCVVVKCSQGTLWGIPDDILEGVEVKVSFK
jgi:hypothetical protein